MKTGNVPIFSIVSTQKMFSAGFVHAFVLAVMRTRNLQSFGALVIDIEEKVICQNSADFALPPSSFYPSKNTYLKLQFF
jgi:hypothetical protein